MKKAGWTTNPMDDVNIIRLSAWIADLGTKDMVHDLGFSLYTVRTSLHRPCVQLPPTTSNVVDCRSVCWFRYSDFLQSGLSIQSWLYEYCSRQRVLWNIVMIGTEEKSGSLVRVIYEFVDRVRSIVSSWVIYWSLVIDRMQPNIVRILSNLFIKPLEIVGESPP